MVALGWHATAGQANSPTSPTGTQIIQLLNKTLDWYRLRTTEQQIATEPVDWTYVDNGQQTADRVMSLGFDFARQAAQLVPEPGQTQAQNSTLPQYQGLVQAANTSNQNVQKLQGELQDLQKKLAASSGKKRSDIEAQISETDSELKLMQARQAALSGMLVFVNSANTGGSGSTSLLAQIEELAKSVPASLSQPSNKSGIEEAPAQNSSAKQGSEQKAPGGIWGYMTDLFRLTRKEDTIKQASTSTTALIQAGQQLRTPLIATLKQMIQNGDQLAAQADTSGPSALGQEKQQLDALTAQFKQVSAALVPLSEQAILLDVYNRNLSNWKNTVHSEYKEDLRNLLVRLAVLAIIIAVVFGAGELWRKTIFRYVQDARRRYQLLLLRRVVLWIAITIVLVFTFASELGSVVTFAGLITAGVAVAMQNVIVSIVGYFFLIGKYGVRVGDRVQVSGVTGEVVDIGMVRFHLMELAAGATDFHPTGRVVAFSNSIVFQPTAGLFKQIPGTSFVWHEIKLVFAPENDYHVVRERVNQAVDTAFSEYKPNLEFQRQQMERSLTYVSAAELKPKVRLHFMSSGTEVVIRYPVVLQNAVEIDDRLTRELFGAVDRDPKLKVVGSEIPTTLSA